MSPSPKTILRWVLPALALIVGFADLWIGGITIGPLALVIGYCVLIPWAIWARPGVVPAVTDPSGYRPSYPLAVAVGVVVLAIYVVTLAPTTAMWDTSEYMAAAYTMGLPHPPGNPFFVLVGRVFSLLPIAPTVGQRINLIAGP